MCLYCCTLPVVFQEVKSNIIIINAKFHTYQCEWSDNTLSGSEQLRVSQNLTRQSSPQLAR